MLRRLACLHHLLVVLRVGLQLGSITPLHFTIVTAHEMVHSVQYGVVSQLVLHCRRRRLPFGSRAMHVGESATPRTQMGPCIPPSSWRTRSTRSDAPLSTCRSATCARWPLRCHSNFESRAGLRTGIQCRLNYHGSNISCRIFCWCKVSERRTHRRIRRCGKHSGIVCTAGGWLLRGKTRNRCCCTRCPTSWCGSWRL